MARDSVRWCPWVVGAVCPVPAADHPRRPRCRRVERLGPLGATHTEPGNLHTVRAVIDMPTQRAYSALDRGWARLPVLSGKATFDRTSSTATERCDLRGPRRTA